MKENEKGEHQVDIGKMLKDNDSTEKEDVKYKYVNYLFGSEKDERENKRIRKALIRNREEEKKEE